MALSTNDAVALAADDLIPAWQTERKKLDVVDRWARWDHEAPHKPRHATPEYRELSARAQAPWGALIVTSVLQTLYVEGYRRPDNPEAASGWGIWQANGWDARQVALHRAVLTYGLAYSTVLPGKTLAGEPMPVMRGVSPREMIAVFDDPADDEWPLYALRVRKAKDVLRLALFDEEMVHYLTIGSSGDRPVYERFEAHDAGVCPVVRYTNRFDLEGRSAGEVEPFIPLLGRIDQTVFDRLVVQRFASWIVRTIAGMDVEATAKENGVSIGQALLQLKANDFLSSPDADTKFGHIPATPLDGFIKSEERDLTDLAATSQTPAFELLGQMANMSAEALGAAKSSQDAKSGEIRHIIGEHHEQTIRLAEHVAGNPEGASDFMAEVRWADTSLRSIAVAVDALGKMAKMLDFPPHLLWEKVPTFTRQEIDEAKKWAEEHPDALDNLASQLGNNAKPNLSVA